MIFKMWEIKASPWPRGCRPRADAEGRRPPEPRGGAELEPGPHEAPFQPAKWTAQERRRWELSPYIKPFLVDAIFSFKASFLIFLGKQNSKFYKAKLVLFKKPYHDALYTALNILSRMRKRNVLLMKLVMKFICLNSTGGKKYLLFAFLVWINLNVNGVISICFFQLILTGRQKQVTERLFCTNSI